MSRWTHILGADAIKNFIINSVFIGIRKFMRRLSPAVILYFIHCFKLHLNSVIYSFVSLFYTIHWGQRQMRRMKITDAIYKNKISCESGVPFLPAYTKSIQDNCWFTQISLKPYKITMAKPFHTSQDFQTTCLEKKHKKEAKQARSFAKEPRSSWSVVSLRIRWSPCLQPFL